ncbi:glycine decarboxylase subunit T [Sugiyamaella lignohabitans]|uniref:Aminomethyltransferase n=1 Tax=Sugiyamaella lignohabitans TaxID=796027 RepID=A0A167DUB8_9ASCO|nr:glycine decarboxylase subunit T [Sugiyamaella lignohabitans]ANB13300.1 glycine decarboxylase subunit T [Sugiyamaella lignohabitans]
MSSRLLNLSARRPIFPRGLVKPTQRFNSSATDNLAKTALYDLHVEYGGKMVPYAGFSMPVLYKDQTHIESHNWVREKAGLFDVSHMLQHRISGTNATRLLEKITPSDVKGLKPFTSTLSVLLNEQGGIIDDTIISKHGENDFYVVTNAGCRDKDLAFIKNEIDAIGSGIKHEIITGGLLALQGPEAAKVLQKFTNYDLNQIKFGESAFVDLEGDKYHVARGGYTGEDGFEVSITNDKVAQDFAYKLLEVDSVKPIGLAARDSLRLEAGMCLYGHELSEEITPVASALTWVIGKSRRSADDEIAFNGKSVILDQIATKKTNLRVGLTVKGPAARDGAEIFAAGEHDKPIGIVTSGSLSPTLKVNIGMGYVPRKYAKAGTQVEVLVRGKFRPGEIQKLPFVKPNYFR